jgi:hypothetical protein
MTRSIGAFPARDGCRECQMVEADGRTLAGRELYHEVTFDAVASDTKKWGRRGASRDIGLRP